MKVQYFSDFFLCISLKFCQETQEVYVKLGCMQMYQMIVI